MTIICILARVNIDPETARSKTSLDLIDLQVAQERKV